MKTNLSLHDNNQVEQIEFIIDNGNFSFNSIKKGQIGTTFPKLKRIFLSNNTIKFIPSYFFASLPKLTEIHIDENQVKELPSDIFKNNINLEKVHLSWNEIKFLHEDIFQSLVNLTEIWLDHNSIETLNSDLFKNCLKLKLIDLSKNQIKTIHVDFKILHKLRYLDLSDNVCISREFQSRPAILSSEIETNCAE